MHSDTVTTVALYLLHCITTPNVSQHIIFMYTKRRNQDFLHLNHKT